MQEGEESMRHRVPTPFLVGFVLQQPAGKHPALYLSDPQLPLSALLSPFALSPTSAWILIILCAHLQQKLLARVSVPNTCVP